MTISLSLGLVIFILQNILSKIGLTDIAPLVRMIIEIVLFLSITLIIFTLMNYLKRFTKRGIVYTNIKNVIKSLNDDIKKILIDLLNSKDRKLKLYYYSTNAKFLQDKDLIFNLDQIFQPDEFDDELEFCFYITNSN